MVQVNEHRSNHEQPCQSPLFPEEDIGHHPREKKMQPVMDTES